MIQEGGGEDKRGGAASGRKNGWPGVKGDQGYRQLDFYRQEGEMFYALHGTIWRPPYEAGSALVQVTAGCTHHKCKFCTLYEDVPFKFRMSPLSEVEADLKEISRCYRNAKRVFFFTGANPFVLSFDKLKTLAELVGNITPECSPSDALPASRTSRRRPRSS